MAGPAYLYATPQCQASTNAPNLVGMPVFAGRATGTAQCRAAIPQFDVQRTSALCSTVAALRDVPIFRASATLACSMGQLPRLYGRLPESSASSVLSNTFTGNSHRIITPLVQPMTLVDTYIRELSWSGMLAAGHVMEVRDNRGTLLARLVSGQASDPNFSSVPINRIAVGGYQVQSLDSGVLLVTTGRPVRN